MSETKNSVVHAVVPAEAWSIDPHCGLDRIHVFWMDVAPSAGYVTIICYGQAWTAYFGAMGGRTIRQFFTDCDTGYMVTKLGIAPLLKQSKKHENYLGRIVEAVKGALSTAEVSA